MRRVFWLSILIGSWSLSAVALTLMDPSAPEKVSFSGTYSDVTTFDNKKVNCNFADGVRGMVAAKEGTKRLVVFDPKQWESSCGTSSQMNPPMAWFDESDNVSISAFPRLGDALIAKTMARDPSYKGTTPLPPAKFTTFQEPLCKALKELEKNKNSLLLMTEAAVAQCGEKCKAKGTFEDLGDQILQHAVLQYGNKCMFLGISETNNPKCNFGSLLMEAKKSSNCVSELKDLSCEYSPWRDLDLQQRYDQVLEMSKPYFEKQKVNPNYALCIASAETDGLEPMAKAAESCSNATKYSSAGLAMTTATTLELFISNGFRPSSMWFQEPSYLVCDNKLFEALASSPELQMEVMAHHLAANAKITGNNWLQAISNYRGGGSAGHTYAIHVSTCVSCLDSAQKSHIRDPLECLSASKEKGRGIPGFAYITGFSQHKARCESENEKAKK